MLLCRGKSLVFVVVGLKDTGLVIRGGQEGFLRALGAGERGRTASAGQGTRDLILRGRGDPRTWRS